LNLSGDSEPVHASAIHASADFFELFGAMPVFSRTFSSEEDRPGGDRSVSKRVPLPPDTADLFT
jgi:hypothetical protein